MTIAGNFSSAQIVDFVWPEHEGVDGEPPALEAFDGITPVSRLQGDVGYALTKDLVAQGDSETGWDTKTGFGDSVSEKPMEPSSSSYQIANKRQESFSITDQERAEIEDIVGSTDPVDLATFIGNAIRYQIWYGYHSDLDGLLTDTNLNENVTASNTWDQASGDPVGDFHAAEDRLLGRMDTAIMGLDVFRALQFSDVVREFSGVSIDATNGAASRDQVQTWLEAIFGVQQILVPEMYFNNANYGQSMVSARVFDGTMWVGQSDAVVNLEQDNEEPEAETESPAGEGREIWYGTRTMEPHRVGETRLGVVIDSVV